MKKISIKSLSVLLNKAQAVVQKTSRKNVTKTVLIFSSFLFLYGRHGCKNHNQHNRTALKQNKKKHMHTGKEPEAQLVQKGCLSCDSDAPQVRSARSDSTRVVKLNHRTTNRRKMRPYCTSFSVCKDQQRKPLHFPLY